MWVCWCCFEVCLSVQWLQVSEKKSRETFYRLWMFCFKNKDIVFFSDWELKITRKSYKNSLFPHLCLNFNLLSRTDTPEFSLHIRNDASFLSWAVWNLKRNTEMEKKKKGNKLRDHLNTATQVFMNIWFLNTSTHIQSHSELYILLSDSQTRRAYLMSIFHIANRNKNQNETMKAKNVPKINANASILLSRRWKEMFVL